MGNWSHGPFDNDGAADFLSEAADASPRNEVSRALRVVADATAETYLEVDEGQAAHAAAELVAMAFGRGAPTSDLDAAVEIAARVRPTETLRLLALRAVDRFMAPNSELSDLWDESQHAETFRAVVDDLRSRLEASRDGVKTVPRPKAGDVLVVDVGGTAIVLQIAAAREVVVFEGTCADDAEAMRLVATAPGVRVPCEVMSELRRARVVGTAPVSKAHKGKKLYAVEVGPIEQYALVTAAFGGWKWVDYETASGHDMHDYRSLDVLAKIRDGAWIAPRVRSPEEREQELRSEHRENWAKRRHNSTPGPFGDVDEARRWLEWIRVCGGAGHALSVLRDVALGRQGSGRPNEQSERRTYLLAALVAVWRGTWPMEDVPESIRSLIPPTPSNLDEAIVHARMLTDTVLGRDCALRMIWDEAPDGGEAIRRCVDALRDALSPDAL